MKSRETESRQKMLLAVLALLLPILAWQYLKPMLFSPARVRAADVERAIRNPRNEAILKREILNLRLASLDAAAGQYEPGRNIFILAPKQKPPPPPPPPSPPPPPRRATTPGPPPPPAAPRPPKLDVELLGIMGPERRRIAVLSDGELFINALENDVIKDKFIIHRIGYESVDFKFIGFPDVPPARIEIGGDSAR